MADRVYCWDFLQKLYKKKRFSQGDFITSTGKIECIARHMGVELMKGVLAGDIEHVKELCEDAGTHVNYIDEAGWTVLMAASNKGHREIAELLIGKGARVDLANGNGWTALMSASGNGHKGVVKLLLEKDAEVNRTDNTGWTALMVASKNGHREIVELLIEKGAEVDRANRRMDDGRHEGVVELLMAGKRQTDTRKSWSYLLKRVPR